MCQALHRRHLIYSAQLSLFRFEDLTLREGSDLFSVPELNLGAAAGIHPRIFWLQNSCYFLYMILEVTVKQRNWLR